jgi:predicted secreted hydrolase
MTCLLVLSFVSTIAACGTDTVNPADATEVADTSVNLDDTTVGGTDTDAIILSDLPAADDANAEVAPPEECSFVEASCEGNSTLTCVNGFAQRQDCGVDAYCNHGGCEATTIVLPRDAGSHMEQSEWWYYTGHLADGDQQWGFEVTIFQYDFTEMFQTPGLGYMCHVAITDKTAKEHYHVDTVALETKTWTASPIVLEVDYCRFEIGGDGNDHIVGVIPEGLEKDGKASPWTIDLTVQPQKRVARHGTDGIIPMSDSGGTSWYYSFTRLAAQGTLSTPDGQHTVTGQAWMDHQWGAFDTMKFKGWDWWSVQLEDGWEIMLFQFTNWDGVLVQKAGTLIDPDGNLTALEGMDAFLITPVRTWPSPHTDGVYPMDWDITIPEGNWSFSVTTSVDDQEMYNIAQNYWEGETTVTGTRSGTAIKGVGYTELTGYATDALDPPK